MGIKRTLRTHYYQLEWSTDYGETKKNIYLAIRGKIEEYSVLHLTARNCSMAWHKTKDEQLKEISRKAFISNANKNNITKFYSLDKYNKLLNYPKYLQETVEDKLIVHYSNKCG